MSPKSYYDYVSSIYLIYYKSLNTPKKSLRQPLLCGLKSIDWMGINCGSYCVKGPGIFSPMLFNIYGEYIMGKTITEKNIHWKMVLEKSALRSQFCTKSEIIYLVGDWRATKALLNSIIQDLEIFQRYI